jgi:hypothetical protein
MEMKSLDVQKTVLTLLMATHGEPEEELDKLEGCLARLRAELGMLDDLGMAFAALKLCEACEALDHEIRLRQNLGSFE